MEVVPGEEIVQVVVAFTLSNYILYPRFLHLFIREDAEKHINLVNVKIQHHQLYQHIVRHVVDRVVVIAPQAMFLLEFPYEILLY